MDHTEMSLEMKISGIEVRFAVEIKENKVWYTSCVTAKKDFSPGEIIEVSPITLLSVEDSRIIEGTDLLSLCFEYKDRLAVTGGYASMCHQSKNPNAVYAVHQNHRALITLAKKEIQREDIITINRPGLPEIQIGDNLRHLAPWKQEGIAVRQSPGRGLGVYATRPFKEGEYVEICHLYSLSEQESVIVSETEVNNYVFPVGSAYQFSGWAVGYGCFYNHSLKPNIYPYDELDDIHTDHLAFRALRDIEAGEELVHDYTDGEPDDVWFDVVE